MKFFKVGEIGKYDEEGVFFRKKNIFIFLNAFFKKNGKAQNEPVVAGRLVTPCNEILYTIIYTLRKITATLWRLVCMNRIK